MRASPTDCNIIRQEILDHCTTPLSANQLCDILDVNKNAIYKAIRYLKDESKNYLAVSEFREVKKGKRTLEHFYLTLNSNYQPDIESPPSVPETYGARLISFSTNSELQKHLLKTSQAHRSERKSPRVHISGAQTYA